MKHLQEPWHLEYFEGPETLIVDTDGEVVARVNTHAITDDGYVEAGDEYQANARLIAAAPELLEALLIALPYVETALEEQGYKPGVVDRMVKYIRDAIDKACQVDP